MTPEARRAARANARSIAVAVFLALVLRAFVVQAYSIPSGSMIPTLEIGDRIFVNRFVYGVRMPFTDVKIGADLRPPRRGEVIVFRHPLEDKDLIKRVVGVPGDRVEVRDNVVYINGAPLERSALGDDTIHDYDETSDHWLDRRRSAFREQLDGVAYTTLFQPGGLTSFGPVVVPARSLFVMGDNRDLSSDSRYWGFVPLDKVEGRALFVWWSAGGPDGVRVGRFGHLVR
jgi:signal peptidase I